MLLWIPLPTLPLIGLQLLFLCEERLDNFVLLHHAEYIQLAFRRELNTFDRDFCGGGSLPDSHKKGGRSVGSDELTV